MRREMCACGVLLVAFRDDWDGIAVMLWRHYLGDQHRAWSMGGLA